MVEILIFFKNLLLIFYEDCLLFLQFINCKLVLILFMFKGLDVFGDFLDAGFYILTVFEVPLEFRLELLKFLFVFLYFRWENVVIFLSEFLKLLLHYIFLRTGTKMIILIFCCWRLPLLCLEICVTKLFELFNLTRVFILKVFVLLVYFIFMLLAFESFLKGIFQLSFDFLELL